MKFDLFARPATVAASVAVAIAASLALPAQAAGTPSNRGAGVNLSGFDYWSPDMSTIDQFKRAGGWYTQCNYPKDANCKNFSNGASSWDTLEQSKLEVDEFGWVKRLPDANDQNVKFRTVSVLMFQDDSRIHPAGKYTVLYEGKGTITYGLAGRKVDAESRPGRDIVQVTNSDSSGLQLSIIATDPADYLRNIRVLPPGGVCSDDHQVFAMTSADCSNKGLGTLITFENLPGRTWHPNFINDLKGFRTIRFLDWNRTNTSTLANWVDRPRLNDAVWTGPYGVPVNAMVTLANEVGADPWINLPTHATDDYAMRFARQLKGVLAPKLNLIVEYSNEPWNYGFSQAGWMRDQAAAQWPDQIRKGVSAYTLQPSWYGMRSAQLCQIMKKEFGADAARLKCVFNGQASSSWVGTQQMDCPFAQAQMGGTACYKSMDGLAIAPYFGQYISNMKVRSTVKTWYSDSDGGVGKLFQEILAQDDKGNKVTPPLYGKIADSDINGAVAAVKGWMVSNKKETSDRGLPLMAYEGGQHLVMAPGDNDQQWMDLMIAANRDRRMGTAYTRTLADWQAAGGTVYTLFNHVNRPGKYGVWGLKENQNNETAYKWQAVLPYRDTKGCWWDGCNR